MLYTLAIVIIVFLFIIFLTPLIVLVRAWRSTNFSENYLSQGLPYSSDISGFAGLPNIGKGDQLIGQATNQEICENGYFVGSKEMTNVNCTQICNATSSQQFMYKYIDRNDIIINNQYLRKGSWCLPTSLARCNLNISTAVKALGRYECVSKYPQLLGGPYGNDIVSCAPTYEFNDNLKKITYTNNVPSTLVIDDIDERLPNSNKYRYTCNMPNYFETFITRPDLGNRFQLFYDACTFFDSGGKMVNNKCECSEARPRNIVKPLNEGQQTSTESICSSCTSGYEIIDEKLPQFGSKYGLSIGINCVDPINIEYYKSMAIEENGVIPCGVQTLLSMRNTQGSKNFGCHRVLINTTNTYTPEMLQRING